jgi:Rieske Fe-S protein
MVAPASKEESGAPPPGGDRRRFFERVAAAVVGAVVGLPPLIAGAIVFLNPLKAKSSGARWVKLADLSSVPADGTPRSFPVILDRWDAWNYYPPAPVGAVYLIRPKGAKKPTAFTATCPHLGCFVEYRPAAGCFKCPCHDSVFATSGQMTSGVSPRGMDTLEVEVRKGPSGPEVWVGFQNFQAGKPKKLPV